MKKIIAILLAILCMSAARANADDVIYIAATMPLTGSDVYQWEVQRSVMSMAVDEINAAGGVLGRKLHLDCFDDAGDPAQGVMIIQSIVDDPKYVALL